MNNSSSMCVLVTRPQAQGLVAVRFLRKQGLSAEALPLIHIEPVADPQSLDQAWQQLSRQDWVFFVSPNAVQQFFSVHPAAWPPGVRVGALGPGTSQALLDCQVPADLVTAPLVQAEQVDSEALWAQLAHHTWAGCRVLIVRGDGGRTWLADQMAARGAQIEFLQAYRRTLPVWGKEEHALLAQALAQPSNHLWLFSSSQSIDHLLRLSGREASVWRAATALVTHPRIAERAREAGFGQVLQTRPDLPAVAACIQSAAW